MAKNYKGITLEIGGDTTKLNKALEGVIKQSKSIQSELKNVNSALKLDPSNVTLITNKQRLLTEQVDKTEEKLKLLKDAQRQFIEDGGDINSDVYASLESDIVKTEEALKNLNKEQSGLSANMESFAIKADQAGDKLISAGKKTAAVSAAATGALTGMAAAAISFDQAWTGVKKVYQGSDDDLDAIKKSIHDLSNVTGTAAVDIAAVAEAGATLGITGNDLITFTEVMVKLGDTTSVTSEEAADSLGKLMNITGTTADEYENLASAIVNLGNKTAASEDTIISISQRFASAGTQAGMTEADILGLSAAMNAVGVEGEAAGSSLSRTTNKINSAVASSSKELEVFAATAGMTSEEFQRAWKDDAGSAFESVVVGLNRAAAEGEDLTAILNAMGISSTNDVNAMLSLATSSDVLTDSLRIANEGWDENTALATESGTYYDSVGSKMDQLKQTVINLAAQMGEVLIPILTEIVDWLKGVVQWFSDLNPSIQKVIVVILGLLAALSPVLLALGGMAKGISNIIRLGGKLSKIFGPKEALSQGLAKNAVLGGNMTTSMTGIATPVLAVAAAVAVLVGAFVTLWNTNEEFRKNILAIWERISNTLSEFFQGIVDRVNELGFNFKDIADMISTIWMTLCDFLAPVFEGAFTYIANTIEFFTSLILSVLDIFIGLFTGDWEQLWDGVVGIFETIWNYLVSFVGNIIQTVMDIFSVFFEKIGTSWEEIWESVANFFIGIWEGIVDFFTKDIPKAFNSVVKFFSDIGESIKDFVSDVGEFVSDCISSVGDFIMDRVNDVATFFTKTIPETINNIIQWFQKLPYYIGYVIGTIIGFILNLGIKLYEFATVTIPEFILGIINWFAQLPGKIGAFVSEVLTNIMTWVVDMGIQAYKVGSEFVGGIVTWFSQLPGKVWSFISDTFNKVSTWAGDMTNKAIKVGSEFINGIVTWFQQLPGKVWGFLSDVVNKVITWGGNMASEAWNAAVNVYNTIADEIGKLPGKMIEIGVAIVEGIWEGIQSMAGWIGDQIGGFCGGIWDGITDFFGINSPSRLMRDTVGNYIAQGIGVGFVDEMSSVNKDIMKSLDSTTGSIQDALDMEASKQLAFETMATQDFSTTLGTFQNSILGTVEQMMSKIVVQHNFVVGKNLVTTEVTPLFDEGMNTTSDRGGRK